LMALTRSRSAPQAERVGPGEHSTEASTEPPPTRESDMRRFVANSTVQVPAPMPVATPVVTTLSVVETVLDEVATLRQDIDMLLSPTKTDAEKWAVWKKLREGGHLSDVIGELKKRQIDAPDSAVVSATLGAAYLLNAGVVKDPREQGINGLNADKSFDEALRLDPKNWEAQYWKAYGMTYWPAEMNKTPEIFERLTNLLKQQESQPAQPHYAQTYQLLGDQYEKAGFTTEAQQVWQRGAAFFPANPELRSRLAPR
jgi:hypothetical protein